MNNSIVQTNHKASCVIYREYDDYLTSKQATTSYLRLEEEIILNHVNRLAKDNRQIGIDIGCGTGRISILINKYFKKLFSFDISEEMLSEAKKKNYLNKPEFIKYDVNLGIENFLNSNLPVSFICASFGVGSCIENLNQFINSTIKVLNKNGIIILSFYNRNYTAITTNTNDLPFSALLNPSDNLITVNYKSSSIPIKIHTYTYHELQVIVDNYDFVCNEFYFLPTLSGLIKNNFLLNKDFMEKIIDIDRSLLQYKNTVSAPYILLILRKLL